MPASSATHGRRMDRQPRARQCSAAAVDDVLVAAIGQDPEPQPLCTGSRCIFSCSRRTRAGIRGAICGSRSAAARARATASGISCTSPAPSTIASISSTNNTTPSTSRSRASPLMRAQLHCGSRCVPDGRPPGQLRSDAQRRASPARARGVDGHVRAQCAQAQRHPRRRSIPRRGPTSFRSVKSMPCCISPSAWTAAASSACSAIERSAMNPCRR